MTGVATHVPKPMKPSILLRIGSVLSLLYFAGHTMGVPWTPSNGRETAKLIETMKSHRFEVTGSSRTYWDFYLGFGFIIAVHLLVQTVALWHLGKMSKTDAGSVRPLVALFGLALVANAILVWRFFFVVPLVFAVATALCLGLAWVAGRAKRRAPAASSPTT